MKEIICAMLVLIALSSCQKSKSSNPIANVREATKDQDLQNKNFTSNCTVKPLDALATGLMSGGQSSIKSESVVYRFEGENIIHQTRLFNSSDCTGDAALVFEETGTVKIETDPNKRTPDLGRNIEMDFDSLQLKVANDAGAVAANAIKLCGISNWAANQSRDVEPQSKDVMCYAAQVPRHVSNIYRLDAGNLYFGTLTKGSVAESERPSSLDTTEKYTAK